MKKSNIKDKKHRILFFCIIFIIITLSVVSNYKYVNFVENQLGNSICSKLDTTTHQQKEAIASSLDADIGTLKNIAEVIHENNQNMDKILYLLNYFIENTSFDYILCADTNGIALENTGNILDLSSREYVQEALTGKVIISDPLKSFVNGEIVTPIAVPIYNNNNKVVGLVIGSYQLKNSQQITISHFNDLGQTFIFTSNGEIVANGNSVTGITSINNIIQFFENAEFISNDERRSLSEKFKTGHPGHMSFKMNGENFYAHYEPLGISDWVIMNIIDYKNIAVEEMIIQRASVYRSLSVVLTTIALFISFYIYQNWSHNKYIKELTQIAHYDSLTGLPNFYKFKLEMQALIDKYPHTYFACVIFDMNNFKYINKKYGLKTGDDILLLISKCIDITFKDMPKYLTTSTRIYADIFAVFYPIDTDNLFTENKKIKIHSFFKEIPNLVEHRMDFFIGRYIGELEEAALDIYEKANLAHCKAQKEQPNMIVDYSDTQSLILEKTILLQNKLEKSFEHNEFQVYLQSKYSFEKKKICGAEALTRWFTNDEFIPPSHFIPLMERNGMIVNLDFYVFRKTCELLSNNLGYEEFSISVNLSRLTLLSPNIVDELYNITQEYNVEPSSIIIEITETLLIEDINTAIIKSLIKHFHKHGFLISMDDFGSGYSSLGFLDEILVDEIKLDIELIKNICHNERTLAIVRNTIKMALDVGVSVVAEGIETFEQSELLKKIGCDNGQGYFYGKPMPPEEFFSSLDS